MNGPLTLQAERDKAKRLMHSKRWGEAEEVELRHLRHLNRVNIPSHLPKAIKKLCHDFLRQTNCLETIALFFTTEMDFTSSR